MHGGHASANLSVFEMVLMNYRPTRRKTPRGTNQPVRATVTVSCLLILLCTMAALPAADAFASWFVDRRISCMTDLAENEIIMNNAVLPHSGGPEPGIRIEVSALEGVAGDVRPDGEYVVKFVLPDHAAVSDVQYVLELIGDGDGGEAPAKFTTAPSGGGIGCEGRRTHGKAGSGDAAAIFTIGEQAKEGSTFGVVGGWATGHESVTLTERVDVTVGGGIAVATARGQLDRTDDGRTDDGRTYDDADFLDDDAAEAEFEEEELEEEREELERDIESAEEDAVEALEEKRIETEGVGSEVINEAEEEIVEVLEEEKKDVNEAIDSLRDEIANRNKEAQRIKALTMDKMKQAHDHTVAQRREAERKFRESHKDQKDKLSRMNQRFKKVNDERRDKLDNLIDMKDQLREKVQQLNGFDRGEHDRARREHIKALPKAELKVDMEELRRKAKHRVHEVADRLGVNEMLNDPKVKRLRGQLKANMPSRRDEHGDGVPLPPQGRHFLVIMFGLFLSAATARWYLDKRRRANKGRRNL